ncbi:hypothetical protein PHLCEN_2v1129, partial [Hermanssonia centrifuga]
VSLVVSTLPAGVFLIKHIPRELKSPFCALPSYSTMSANPEDLSYIHRRCVLVDELVSLEWAHPPYNAKGTMELLARIRAAALPSGPIIDIEDTPPVTPIEDNVPLALETEIGSYANILMHIAREIRDMH